MPSITMDVMVDDACDAGGDADADADADGDGGGGGGG